VKHRVCPLITSPGSAFSSPLLFARRRISTRATTFAGSPRLGFEDSRIQERFVPSTSIFLFERESFAELAEEEEQEAKEGNVISNRCCLRESCVNATSLLEFVRILKSSVASTCFLALNRFDPRTIESVCQTRVISSLGTRVKVEIASCCKCRNFEKYLFTFAVKTVE